MNLITLAVISVVLVGHADPNRQHKSNDKTTNQSPTRSFASIPAPDKDKTAVVENHSNDKQTNTEPQSVRVLSMPQWDWIDWVLIFGNVVLVVVGIGGICVATSTLGRIERQTAATEKQANHMVATEGPFVIVETRGDYGREFWMRNCGKSPAQILFVAPVIVPDFPAWDQGKQDFELPVRPAYGLNYWDDQWEQINVQWLGPGDERCFTSFDPNILTSLPQETRTELNGGLRAIRLYSSIKYRGMFDHETVYHSRFCYGWGPSGTYLTGPHGYNKYT